MQRIIDGVLFESNTIADSWEVRTFLVNGHKEVSARQMVTWHEVGAVLPYERTGDGYKGAATLENVAKWAEQDAADLEDKRLHSLKKSAQRAKSMCRKVIKAENFNELLTLTYRENQQDRELCKKHFKEWVRRMKKALGGFRYCAGFEPQERGAMHVHVACHKLASHGTVKGVKIKAWELGTRIWRDVVGDVQLAGPLRPGEVLATLTGGLCFVGGKVKNGGNKRRRNMSIGKMASYVSKYIMKDYENAPEEKNRYSRSNGTVVPKATLQQFHAMSLLQLIDAVFECCGDDVIISHRIAPLADGYWLVTEPNPGGSR